MLILLYLIIIGILAGLVGSIIGIGGGVLIVPALTLILKVPIKYALGTSIICVMVTSLSTSSRFLRKNLVNIPLGLTLEIPTTIGGIIGSFSVAFLNNKILFIIFASFTAAAGIFVYVKNRLSLLQKKFPVNLKDNNSNNNNNNNNYNSSSNNYNNKNNNINANNKTGLSMFSSKYYDENLRNEMNYKVGHTFYGGIVSFFAGIFSGLLGIGGGVLKVPAMNIIMGVPLKVATATSNYMIGITAVVSSIIYFFNGYINTGLTIPVLVGVVGGATIGSYLAVKLKNIYISIIILLIFILISITMFLRAFGILSY